MPIWDESKVTTKDKKLNDFQTPSWVVKYMVSLIPKNTKNILEPTSGQGNIIRELDGEFKIDAPEDFFLMKRKRFDCVIMNPPFSSKYANIENAPQIKNIQGMRLGYYFLTECMEMSDHVIALMPWFTVSDSDVRIRYLIGWGLKSITALPRKAFQYVRIQTCILELSKGYSGKIEFKYLGGFNKQIF